jgi:hypothetical protein
MPRPLLQDADYARLYASTQGIDSLDEEGTNAREIRIPTGLTAAEVYRQLPSAPDFEYAGYLTKTRIRYASYGATTSTGPNSKLCTFHTHPTEYDQGDPDMPSPQDIYSFLKWRHRRAITVGKDLLWVMDKTRRTIPVIRRLYAWETEHMVPQMIRHFAMAGPEGGVQSYLEFVLSELGWKLPVNFMTYKRCWPEMLREKLRIKVTVLRR